MVKKTNRPAKPTQAEQKKVEVKVDYLARILQIAALVLCGILTLVDLLVANTELPVWLVPAIFGIAAGLSPEQIAGIVKDLIKTVLSGKRQ